jgi:hypothetical protein
MLKVEVSRISVESYNKLRDLGIQVQIVQVNDKPVHRDTSRDYKNKLLQELVEDYLKQRELLI